MADSDSGVNAGAVERAGRGPTELSPDTFLTISTVFDGGLPVKALIRIPPTNGARIPNPIAEEMKKSRGQSLGDSRLLMGLSHALRR
jgi:hypothetical protein